MTTRHPIASASVRQHVPGPGPVGFRLRRLPLDARSVDPQVLQAVELPLLLFEDVDHEVDEVEEHPPRSGLALPANGPGPLRLEGPLHLLGDGLDLAL